MVKFLSLMLQSLNESNYLIGTCSVLNGKVRCQTSLLKNGLKLREQLLKQLLYKPINWSTQFDVIQETNTNPFENNQINILQRIVFQKSHRDLCNEKLINMANSIAWKIMNNRNASHFENVDSLFHGSDNKKTVLVTDFFVAEENDLFKFNNFQRERKVWWMKFSANPSRYSVEPCQISISNGHDQIFKNSKSMSIKAEYTYGSTEVENIYFIPLNKSAGSFDKISLIRSVINLDLASSALILDSSILRSDSKNLTLMLNRKLAPFQIWLINLNDPNTTEDELTIHLQHVISRSGLRLYDSILNTSFQMNLEKKLLQSDSVGIPYVLLIDDESTRCGLIRMRSRDTTLFEIIHITDIPSYLINIFEH